MAELHGRSGGQARLWPLLSCLLLAACPPVEEEHAEPDPLFDPCGVSEWGHAADLPDRVFVSEDGSPDGDGTQEAPLDRVQDGLNLAADLNLVGVVVGGADGGSVYSEAVRFGTDHRGLELRGRCADLVRIDASKEPDASLTPAPIRVDNGRVLLRDLTLSGGGFGIAAVCPGTQTVPPDVHGTGLVITDNREAGVFGSGSAPLRETHIRLVDSRVEGNHRTGLYAQSGATLHLVSSEVTGNLPTPDSDERGFGIEIRDHGHLVAERTLITENHGYGVLLRGTGATALLIDSQVADTRADGAGRSGAGISALKGAFLHGQRLQVTGSRGVGVWALDDSTVVMLEDSVIRDVEEVDGAGRGIEAGLGALVQLTDSSIQNTYDDGVFSYDAAVVRLLRTTLTENRGWTGVYGAGLMALYGGRIEAQEVVIQGVEYSAVSASGPGSSIRLSDVTIDGVRARVEEGEGGLARAIYIRDGGQIEAERLTINDVDGAGILVVESGSRLTFDELRVTNVGPVPDGAEGHGIAVQAQGLIEGRGLTTADNWRYSVRTADPGSRIVLWDSTIGPASAGAHADDSVGAISITSGSTATLTDVHVPDPLGHALFARGDATVHTERLRVQGTHRGGESALYIKSGARLIDRDSLIDGSLGVGLHARDEGTRIELQGTRIIRSRANSDGRRGRGISLTDGASLVGSSVKLSDNHDVGLVVGRLARASLTDSKISGTLSCERPGSGVGILADLHGEVDLVGVFVEDSSGPGLVASDGGTIRGRGVTLRRNHLAGAVGITAGEIFLDDAVISDTETHAADGGGVGVFAHGGAFPPVLALHRSWISEHPWSAVYLRGAGRYTISSSILDGPQHTAFLPGGLFAADIPEAQTVVDGPQPLALGLAVSQTLFRDMETAALLDRATGRFSRNVFEQVDAPICQQRSPDLAPPFVEELDAWDAGCSTDLVPTRPLLSYTVDEVTLVGPVEDDPPLSWSLKDESRPSDDSLLPD